MESHKSFQIVASIHAPPRGGRRLLSSDRRGKACFNPRPPREGGDAVSETGNLVELASIHAPPRGGRRYPIPFPAAAYELQSTPPREGGDTSNSIKAAVGGASIHAPPRGGRQPLIASILSPAFASIHAPPRGGRLPPAYPDRDHGGFNPRPPARGATGTPPAQYTGCL